MRSFPTGFIAEKNKKSDLAPVWFLRLTVNAVDYWLSDNTFSVAGWQGGITTLPWIKSWGQLRQGISGGLAEFHVADFSCTGLIDPDVADNLEHLATAHDLEQNPAELYLWFHGLDATTDPPQRMWRGYVRDCPLPDDLTVELALEDETVQQNNYVGRKLDITTFPLADPDDIGKIIPIVYGSVSKLRALCVDSGWVTSIVSDISAIDVTITVSELPAYSAANRTIMIDDEHLRISAVNGKSLTVIRGYDGTIATNHAKGSTVIEKKATPLVYLLAEHPLDSIGTILARVRGVNVDITSDCTKYLGTMGNQLAAYPGKAAITIPDFARVSQRISIALQGDVNATDNGHTHGAGDLSNSISTTQTASGTSATDVQVSFSWDAVHNQNRFPSDQAVVARNVSFSAVAGTITGCTMTATVTALIPSTGGYWYLRCNGVRITPLYGMNATNFSPAITHDATSWAGNILSLVIGAYPTGQTAALTAYGEGTISAANRTITTTTAQAVAITKNGANVAVSNTLSLSGNSVADIMVGDMILADCIRNISSPSAVLQNLISTYGSGATVSTIGTLPAGYALNGAITESRRLLEWCNVLAFQCRSRFRMSNGTAQLIVRPDTLTPVKTISQIAQNDGQRALSRSKVPIDEVINKIVCLFDRDWTKSGDEAYLQTSAASNAASIAIFGERERPELFKFDFVTSPAMAASVLNYYLAWCAIRRWRYTFDVFLDHCELEFADPIALGFLSGQVTIIDEARLNPGESNRMDKITFVTEG